MKNGFETLNNNKNISKQLKYLNYKFIYSSRFKFKIFRSQNQRPRWPKVLYTK